MYIFILFIYLFYLASLRAFSTVKPSQQQQQQEPVKNEQVIAAEALKDLGN